MAIYGFHLLASPTAEVNLEYRIGNNSATFTEGDPVSTDADGFLIVSTATVPVAGICAKTVTMASDNETVAKVKVPFYPADAGYRFLAESDANLTQTDLDMAACFADSAGTTGVTYVNGAGGSSGQFKILSIDPRGTGSVTEVSVVVNTKETEYGA